MIALLSLGILGSVIVYFLQQRKVTKRRWILVPFALVSSITILKSAAGIVVDAIGVICFH